MQFQTDSSEPLQKCVVQLLSYSFAFLDLPFQLLLYSCGGPRHPEPVQSPHRQCYGHGAERGKPGGLMKGRENCKLDTVTFFVPNPIVVTRDDLESIFFWFEIWIRGLAARAGVHPI